MALGIPCKCEKCHYNRNLKCNADSIEVRSVGEGG